MTSDASSISAVVEAASDALAATVAQRQAETWEFADAVVNGLIGRPRSIPSRFLYDATGSALFEEITKLEEYYLTRTETALLGRLGGDIAALAGHVDSLVEFGSGSSRKTRLLIDALVDLTSYVPIDVSAEFLAESARTLESEYERLTVYPVVGNFMESCTLDGAPEGCRLGFFSGSTIGNLTHQEARDFLANAAQLLGTGSSFLVGVDLKKDLDILLPAYNDGDGVTAAFSLNLLSRINRELDGDFDTTRFAHRALYNEAEGRIEIYIESLDEQEVRACGQTFSFAAGERIHTEYSYKYTVPEFQALAHASGWSAVNVWTDDDDLFSLHLLRTA